MYLFAGESNPSSECVVCLMVIIMSSG